MFMCAPYQRRQGQMLGIHQATAEQRSRDQAMEVHGALSLV
jgi:hypothetical protein